MSGEKHAGGQPPKYKTSEEIQEKIDAYFVTEEVDGSPFTITGLALFLGFESRQSIYDYEKHGEYSYTIKRARLRIENFAEKKLFTSTPAGAIFALKNFGWKDKQEIDLNHGVKEPDLSQYSDEELDQIEAIHNKHNTV
jgi:hypothetical protein